MTDLCPSCREPVDHPSGDGCAAMKKHQPHEYPSPEAIVKAAVERAMAKLIWQANAYGNDLDVCLIILQDIASDPAEVAAILEEAKKAGEDRG